MLAEACPPDLGPIGAGDVEMELEVAHVFRRGPAECAQPLINECTIRWSQP